MRLQQRGISEKHTDVVTPSQWSGPGTSQTKSILSPTQGIEYVEHFSVLQELLHRRRAFSTSKVYLAVILACHVGFGNTHFGQHVLIRFMKGACWLTLVQRPLVPSWDLPTVLEALSRDAF